jgi:hypothetical protein
MFCERTYYLTVSDLFEHAKQYNIKLTSVIESPMDGTLTLFFSNRGSVADTKLLVCWRAELAPSCEVHRPAARAFRTNNLCRCNEDDISEGGATPVVSSQTIDEARKTQYISRSNFHHFCYGHDGQKAILKFFYRLPLLGRRSSLSLPVVF